MLGMLVIGGSFISPILFFPRQLSKGVRSNDSDTFVSKCGPLLTVTVPDEAIRSHCYFMCVKCLSQQFKHVTNESFSPQFCCPRAILKCKQFGLLTLSSCRERVFFCRNLADQNHQREAGIPMSRWKWLVFPSILTLQLSPYIPPLGESVFKRVLEAGLP